MTGREITPQDFGKLFLRYRDKFISIAMSYIRDEVAAEDIVAESFTKFWDSRDRIELETFPEAYILQSVKNRCLNYLRDKANRARIQKQIQDDSYRAIMAEIGVLNNNEISLIFRSDIESIFRRMLDEIPAPTREIFFASRFESLTYKEIALKYNITPRKVKREIQHVLSIMRTSLKDYLPLIAIAATVFTSFKS